MTVQSPPESAKAARNRNETMSDNAVNKASMQIITRLERENTRLRAELSEALAALEHVIDDKGTSYSVRVLRARAILAKHKDSAQ